MGKKCNYKSYRWDLFILTAKKVVTVKNKIIMKNTRDFIYTFMSGFK